MIRAIAVILALLFAGPALAQGCGAANPNCVVPTAPAGNSTNLAASTAFVTRAITALGSFAFQNYATPPAIGGTTPAAGTFSSLTDTGITGSTQCLQVNSSGQISGFGASCTSGAFGASAAKTANYSIVSSDCNSTITMGTGSTAQLTVTLPALPATGFTGGCTIFVKNADTYTGTTGHGMTLSGFPAELNAILWPQQTVVVQVVNGGSAWQTVVNPGRWKIPAQVTFHVDPASGSNSNDGLGATTSAVATAQQAWSNAVYQVDTSGTTPIIAMACSQTHTSPLSMGGIPLGSNLVQLSPDGNCGFTWYNSGSCIVIGDLAELDLNLTYYGSGGTAIFECDLNNAVSRGQIYLHNQVVLDLEGTPQWQPGGSNDNFLFCDGPCEYTIANGIAQSGGGTGNYVIYMNEGGKGTQSGAISGTGTFNGVYYLFGPAMLILGTANSMSGTVGTSKVYGHATLVNNGITPYGGVSVGTSGVNCTSLTSSC